MMKVILAILLLAFSIGAQSHPTVDVATKQELARWLFDCTDAKVDSMIKASVGDSVTVSTVLDTVMSGGQIVRIETRQVRRASNINDWLENVKNNQ